MAKYLIPLLVFVSSCSVITAASGTPEPEYEKIVVGAPMSQIEDQLGPPLAVKGGLSQYSYTLGNEPAIGRALLYLVGDIFTLFMAEYIFFPLEISQSGDAYEVYVGYNDSNVVRELLVPKEGVEGFEPELKRVKMLTRPST